MCSVAGCEKPARTRGWCIAHYTRVIRHGEPLIGGSLRKYGAFDHCTVVDCKRPIHGNGLCNPHRLRLMRHGDLRAEERVISPHDEREQTFWARVNKTASCWLWTGITTNGYGKVNWSKVDRWAHRIAYRLLVGPIPEGLQLDHLCRNRACVNPDHLEPVTPRENSQRAYAAKKGALV